MKGNKTKNLTISSEGIAFSLLILVMLKRFLFGTVALKSIPNYKQQQEPRFKQYHYSPLITLYFTDLCMQLSGDTFIQGGTELKNIEDEVHCITWCLQIPSCLAVDWRQVCVIHEQILNVTQSLKTPSNHYRKVQCSGIGVQVSRNVN